MSDTQHTPGPWATDGREAGWNILGLAGERVATVWRDGPHRPAANARLIAAAPELLEVLGDILPWLAKAEAEGVFENCVVPKGGQRAINRARAAIAKATGVQS